MEARNRGLPAPLYDLHLARNRVAVDLLKEPEETIRNGEDGIVCLRSKVGQRVAYRRSYAVGCHLLSAKSH